jgi:ABC-type phosphate transport system substrate-binding protein
MGMLCGQHRDDSGMSFSPSDGGRSYAAALKFPVRDGIANQGERKMNVSRTVAMCCLLLTAGVSAWADEPKDTELRASEPLLVSLGDKIMEEFNSSAKAPQKLVAKRQIDSSGLVEQFSQGGFELMFHVNKLDEWDRNLLNQNRAMARNKPPEILLAQMKVVVIVHPSNPLVKLSFPQLQEVLKEGGKETLWPEKGGKRERIVCYSEEGGSIGRQITMATAMRYKHRDWSSVTEGSYGFREDMEERSNPQGVIDAVAGDPNGLGFMLYNGSVPKTVKALAIAKDMRSPAVAPRQGVQGDYAMSQPLVLYVHPQAGDTARQFVKWCAGPKGAKAIEGFLKDHEEAPASKESKESTSKPAKDSAKNGHAKQPTSAGADK